MTSRRAAVKEANTAEIQRMVNEQVASILGNLLTNKDKTHHLSLEKSMTQKSCRITKIIKAGKKWFD